MAEVVPMQDPLRSFAAKKGGHRKRRASVSAACSDALPNISNPSFRSSLNNMKTDEEAQMILTALEENFVGNTLSMEDKQSIVRAMFPRNLPKDMEFIKQGHDGDFFYILQNGNCEVFVNGLKVCEYHASGTKGVAFGELALLYNCPRAATVKTTSECKLWLLGRDVFKHQTIRRNQEKQRQRDEFLSKCDLFKTLTKTEIAKVSDAMIEKTFQKGEVVIREGANDQQSMNFYLILSGTATALKTSIDSVEHSTPPLTRKPSLIRSLSRSNCFEPLEKLKQEQVVSLPPLTPRTSLLKQDSGIQTEDLSDQKPFTRRSVCVSSIRKNSSNQRTVGTMSTGQFFGEKALIEKEPRAATVIATSVLVCGMLTVSSFERLIGSCNEVIKRKVDDYNSPEACENENEPEYADDFESSRTIATMQKTESDLSEKQP